MTRHITPRSIDLVLGPMLAMLVLLLLTPATTSGRQASPTATSTVTASGSATVGPILEAAAESFAAESPDVAVVVERTNSGAGFERFCAGGADIGMSGRTIREEEAATCAEAGIIFEEYEVAYDGVAVVVNPAIDFIDCLTVEQLGMLWSPDSTVSTWQDLDPAWPADPIALFGTGEASGTYQFFTQIVVGEEGVSRTDYNVTEGHPATAEGVIGDPNGLGFLPYPRYVEVQDQVKLLAIDGGDGCVAPDATTIQDGSYAPLSRKLYVYVSHQALARADVAGFLAFYFADAAAYAEAGGLVPSPDEVYEGNIARLEAVMTGGGTPAAATPAT